MSTLARSAHLCAALTSPFGSKLPVSSLALQMVEELRTLSEVMAMTGMRRTWIYHQINAGSFPAPIKSGRSSLWVLSEIDGWVRVQVQQYR